MYDSKKKFLNNDMHNTVVSLLFTNFTKFYKYNKYHTINTNKYLTSKLTFSIEKIVNMQVQKLKTLQYN